MPGGWFSTRARMVCPIHHIALAEAISWRHSAFCPLCFPPFIPTSPAERAGHAKKRDRRRPSKPSRR